MTTPPAIEGAASGDRTVSRTLAAAPLCEHGHIRTILVVDDHPACRAIARTVLEAEGFVVVGEAEDGRSALLAIEELHPEVVLLDVQLPDIDGFEVAAGAARLTPPPLVVLTSSRDARDFGSLIAESGARGFIPKAELSGEAMAALIG